MKYERLLSISLKHSYYKDGLCPDFTVSPQKYSELMLKKDLENRHYNKNTEKWLAEKDTDTLLRNHRCLLKPKVNGIDIFVPVNDNKTPVIEFVKNTRLSFDLRLKNSEFPLFTDLTSIPDNGNFQMLDTAQASDRQFGDKIFATINIQRDFNKIDESSANIDFEFSAKPVRWVYYLVTNQGANDSDFSVMLNAPDSPGYSWQQKLIAESDQISSVLAREYPKMRRLCFISEQSIPCQESGLKNIQLLLGQNKVFENLPAPPIKNYYRTTIDNTPQQADAIFTIVKSITNTTLTKV
jgi:hypothetical protein